jgi:hypothetical protein
VGTGFFGKDNASCDALVVRMLPSTATKSFERLLTRILSADETPMKNDCWWLARLNTPLGVQSRVFIRSRRKTAPSIPISNVSSRSEWGAKTIEVKASRLSLISHPDNIANRSCRPAAAPVYAAFNVRYWPLADMA